MPFPRRAAGKLAIAAFLLRGAFYCVEQPLWEGFDEWAHFAYVEHLVTYGRLPGRSEAVSERVCRSVELAPLAASAAENAIGSLTHDAFWRLPAEERLRRERELNSLETPARKACTGPGALIAYEAQQPPLYYLILALPYLAVRNSSLPAQVLTLRLASVLLAAAGIFLSYRLALRVPACRRAAIPILLLLASWPGLLIGVSRIGNDGPALALGSAVMVCLFRTVCSFRTIWPGAARGGWVLAGVTLGAALLTKSYMLALVPLLPLAALVQMLRQKTGRLRTGSGCLLALALAGLIAGWWYVRNWMATRTLSGEQIDAAAARFGLAGKLAAMAQVNWLRVVDAAAATHIWTGGWSFLGVRSWMYRVFELMVLASGAGLSVLLWRLVRRASRGRISGGDARFSLALCAYLFFCLGLGYYAISVYLARGISTALGWYLYGIAGAETVLLASGFTGLAGGRRAAGCMAALAALACALDLYTVHFISMPYYTGIIAHTPSGRLAAFHVSDLRGIGISGLFERLAVNQPRGIGAPVIAAMWSGYVCATAALAGCSAWMLESTFFSRRKASA